MKCFQGSLDFFFLVLSSPFHYSPLIGRQGKRERKKLDDKKKMKKGGGGGKVIGKKKGGLLPGIEPMPGKGPSKLHKNQSRFPS